MRQMPAFLGGILILALAGCGKEPPPPPAPPVRVENPRIGVAIAALSPDFVVADADGETIELVPAGEGATGRVTVAAGEPAVGATNLVAAVNRHRDEIDARPEGDYKGQAEYVSPLGTTFASRGRFREAGETIEERAVFMVHPWGDRQLTVIYRYPAGDDTQARLDALMQGVVGELEGLPPPAAGGGASPDSS